jgi:tRNA (mo5U34)-methyltransferase
VLYHLGHPLLALERLFTVTGKQLILETHVDLITERVPAMAFYPSDELNRDPSNWWGPNPSCVKATLRDVGFVKVQEIADSDPPSRMPVRAFNSSLKNRGS